MNKLILLIATGAFITYAILRRIDDEITDEIYDAFRQVDQSEEAYYD